MNDQVLTPTVADVQRFAGFQNNLLGLSEDNMKEVLARTAASLKAPDL
jgi:hypothetical protein